MYTYYYQNYAESYMQLKRIAGNFGEVLIWQFGELGKDRQIKNSPIWIIECWPVALRIQIAKYKIRQFLLRVNSPNSMLTKLSHYMVAKICMTVRNLCKSVKRASQEFLS